MKKIIVLFSILTLIVFLVACGKAELSVETEGSSSAKETEPSLDVVTETTEEIPTVLPVDVEALLSEEGGYFEYTYYDHVLNENGQVISRKVKGDSRRTDTFEYDTEGRIIKNTRTSSYGTEIWTYTYDENGLLVEEFQGDRTFKSTYTFDDQNRISTKTMVNVDSDYTMVYSYTYNPDGSVKTETQTSPYSTYILTFTYDYKGRVIKEVSVEEGEYDTSTTIYTYGVVGSYLPS